MCEIKKKHAKDCESGKEKRKNIPEFLNEHNPNQKSTCFKI